MSVPAAFIGVVLIWSTTPLAIQWSSEGWGFLTGATGRMALGTVFCLLLLIILRNELPWHKQARKTYFAAAIGVYGAMMAVYWGAQYIPSGLIAVIYGLSPIVTAVMAAKWLSENSLTKGKVVGAVMGLLGVMIIFLSDVMGGAMVWQGIAAILLAVVLQSASGVWVKRIGAEVSGLAVTTGALLLAVPLYVLTWLVFSHETVSAVVSTMTLRAVAAMIYLGVIGSVIGFSLYFYILKNLQANKVALITLITPVTALLIGQNINGEHISINVWIGTLVILTALMIHQWGDQWTRLKSSFNLILSRLNLDD